MTHDTPANSPAAHTTATALNGLARFAIVGVLITCAYVIGRGQATPNPVDNARTAGAAPTMDDTIGEQRIYLDRRTPPVIAVTDTHNAIPAIALAGAADGRFYLICADGTSIPVIDRRFDLFWRSDFDEAPVKIND